MAVMKIAVPKTPKSAFNKNRPASDLLKAQLEHLEAAAGYVPRSSQRKRKSLTEGQAAARIHELTRMLHPQSAHVPLPSAHQLNHVEEADRERRGRPRAKASKKRSTRARAGKSKR